MVIPILLNICFIIYCSTMFALDLVMQILDYVNLHRTWAKIRKVIIILVAVFCKITTSQKPCMSRYVGYVIPTGWVSLAEY